MRDRQQIRRVCETNEKKHSIKYRKDAILNLLIFVKSENVLKLCFYFEITELRKSDVCEYVRERDRIK